MSEHFDNYMIHKLTIEDPDEQGDQIFHGIFGKIEESEPHTQVSALAPLVKGASATGTSFVSSTASDSSTDQLLQRNFPSESKTRRTRKHNKRPKLKPRLRLKIPK